MDVQPCQVYPCEPLPPVLPLMTTDFYPVDPLGVGTADVESLTGFVARLAATHHNYVPDLLYKPLKDGRPLWPKAKQITHTRMGANGRSESTVEFVQALEERTGLTGLALLTCIPMRDAIADVGLFKPRQYWCPECLQQWADTGAVVYEPLYWTLSTARTCFHHSRPLESQCPTCDRPFSPLLKMHTPGHCGCCGAWLGTSGPDAIQITSQDVRDTADTRRLLACLAQLHKNPSLTAQLRANLGDMDQQIGLSLLMSAIGWRGDKIHVWAKGTVLPTLPVVLRLSQALDVCVDDLLFGQVDMERLARRARMRPQRKGNRDGHGTDGVLADGVLQERAEAVLRTHDFHLRLNIGEMARLLGCSAQKLGYVVPNLRYRLVDQYVHVMCEPLRQILEEKGSIGLSATGVARSLGITVATLQKHAPEFYDQLRARQSHSGGRSGAEVRSCPTGRPVERGSEADIAERVDRFLAMADFHVRWETQDLATTIGFPASAIRRVYPGIRTELTSRYLEVVCAPIKAELARAGHVPQRAKDVAQLAGVKPGTLKRYQPDLYRQLLPTGLGGAWTSASSTDRDSRCRAALTKILAHRYVPTISQIAADLGVSPKYLRRAMPDLIGELVVRRKAQQNLALEQRRAEERARVLETIVALEQEGGLPVTQERVVRRSGSWWPVVRQVMKEYYGRTSA